MMKPTSFGLMGLAILLVIAFCFAYGDELPPVREGSVCHLVSDADLTDSPMIETGVEVPRFAGRVGKQQKMTPASLLQTASPVETASGAIRSDGFQSDREQVEGFHG